MQSTTRTLRLEFSVQSHKSPEYVRTRQLCDSETNTLTSCHSCSDRLTRWTFAFYLVANVDFCIRKISVYLANALATWNKITIEPSFTQHIRATLAYPKMLGDTLNTIWTEEPRYPLNSRKWPNLSVNSASSCLGGMNRTGKKGRPRQWRKKRSLKISLSMTDSWNWMNRCKLHYQCSMIS